MTIGAARPVVPVVAQVVAQVVADRLGGGPGRPGAAPARAGGRGPGIVVGARLGRLGRRACAAASCSQPQRQGIPCHRCNQRTSRHRVQGNHRKAVPVPQRDGTGCRFVGDVRAAGIHHRSLGYGAGQPGCAAQGQHHLVLQGQWSLWVKLVSSGDILGSGPDSGPSGGASLRSAGMLPLLLLLLDRQVAPAV